jgi:ankyrin repeat protein
MKGEEKSQTFKMVLNNQDIIGILKELSRKNLEEIVVYILNEFGIEEKKDNLEINEANEKEERFKDLYFLAIKKGQIKILEALNRQEINFNKIVDNEGNTGLILAVITSDIQIAKFFLKYFPGMLEINEVNEKEERFKDLFFLAIKKGQIKILEALNKQDINFEKLRDAEGNTGLILAVITSDIQIAKFFLKYFPRMLDMRNYKDYSPLLLSVYNNDNLMFFLLANNLENVIIEGNSLLELAIRNENLDIINYLNPKKNKTKCNFLPSKLLLHLAVCQSSLEVFHEIVNMLDIYDYQIQSTLETPLHWAAMKGNYYIIKELIKLYKEKFFFDYIKYTNEKDED